MKKKCPYKEALGKTLEQLDQAQAQLQVRAQNTHC
jgi:hypothetical protein